jgi:hypothetical protein
MPIFPADIFTERRDVAPDTLANLGPLRRLAGSWEARSGVDLAPKPGGPERRVHIERVDMEPIDRRPMARSSSTACAIIAP